MKRQFLAVALLGLGCIVTTGCAPGSQASEGAASGAKSGAVGGAVAGAVASIFWGGNIGQNVIASAAIGAASGAAMGGMSGSESDRQIAEKRAMSEEQVALEQKLGPDNYEAAKQLALCKHKTAIGKARTAYGTSSDLERRKYALLIEAAANEEFGNAEAAAKIYPLYSSIDPSHPSTEKIHEDVMAGLVRVQQVRKEHGLPPTCS